MRIVRMYSGNLAGSQDWKKVEIEVDENDLSSILFEAGLGEVPRREISSGNSFKLLTYEAEILLKTTMVQSFAVDVEATKAELSRFKELKAKLLTQLKESREG